jgi:hypothetical protein
MQLPGIGSYRGSTISVVRNTVYLALQKNGLVIVEASVDLDLKASLTSGERVGLSWNGGPGIKLQKTTSLTVPNWQDVPDSDSVSQIELPRDAAAAFFRLIQP